MTFNQILYFQTIARYEHFRLAAEELHISQPSLSRSIANLEQELGLILFERRGRGAALTKAGRLFLTHADRILQEVELAKRQMQKLSDASGNVDLAYVFPLAGSYIPHIVRQFLEHEGSPDLTFSFHQSHTAEMIEGLKSERYDIIFGSYIEHEPDIRFIPVLTQEMAVITPPGHPLAARGAVSLKDLEQYPLIGYDHSSGLGMYTRNVYVSHSLNPRIVCESPDENAIASLVAENFGIALIANVEILRHFKVEILPLADLSLTHTVYLACLKNRYQIPAVKSFIKFVESTASVTEKDSRKNP